MTSATHSPPLPGTGVVAPGQAHRGSALARRFRIALALACAVVATSAVAQSNTSSAMRVVKDPVTGAIRAATPEEFRAMQAREAQAGKGVAANRGILSRKANPQPTTRADGSVELELTDETMSYSVARRNADGSADAYCVTGADAATDLLKGKKVSAARKIGKEDGHDHQK